MPLVIHHPRRVLSGALLILAASFAVVGWWIHPYAIWFYRTVPLIEFKAACRLYDESELDTLHFIEGRVTAEFISEVHKEYRDESGMVPYTNFADGRMYKPLWFFEPPPTGSAKFGSEQEEYAYYVTEGPAYRILERRKESGAFADIDMRAFMVRRWSYEDQAESLQLMRADECGFVQELILEGGRFANHSMSANEDVVRR